MEDNKVSYECSDNDLLNERVIYAFACGQNIKYIGICESRKTKLKDRLERYLKNKSEEQNSTNYRVVKEIERCLKDGNDVEIYAWKPLCKLSYENLEIDLIIGLEYSLIEEFVEKEGWNKKR